MPPVLLPPLVLEVGVEFGVLAVLLGLGLPWGGCGEGPFGCGGGGGPPGPGPAGGPVGGADGGGWVRCCCMTGSIWWLIGAVW